jgi:hypothetical protein
MQVLTQQRLNMATYITRIELHQAASGDYTTLHSAMEKEGFERTITSDQGVTYHLLEAMYYRDTSLTRQQVLESAKSAAASTKKNFSAFVSETKGNTWSGLTKVS